MCAISGSEHASIEGRVLIAIKPLAGKRSDRSWCRPAARSLVRARIVCGPPMASAAALLMAVSSSLSLAPSCVADAVDNVKAAVAADRAGSSCAPLRSHPVVERVAQVVNKSYNDWLDNNANHVPIKDPRPGLKELGYGGSKGVFVGGVSQTSEAEAIRATLLEGFDKIPDCSYTDFGVSELRNEKSGWYLIALVLAGP